MRSFRCAKYGAISIGVATGLVIAELGAGAASAYFKTTGGTGNGTAATATAKAIPVGTATIVGALYPGGPAANLQVQVTNPYYPNMALNVTSLSGPSTVSATNGCSPTGVTLTTGTVTNGTLSASTQSQTVTFTGAVSMSTSSGTGCQGTTFTISGIVVQGQAG